MTDTFVEQLVKRRPTLETALKKAALVSVTVFAAFMALSFPIFMLVTIGLIFLDSFLFKRMNLEFEYSYFNGEFDVDKIFNRSSRKKVFTTDIKKMEMFAPVGNDSLRGYQRLKVYDFTSKNPDSKVYEMVTPYRGEMVRVWLEPNENLLESIRNIAPRKVIF